MSETTVERFVGIDVSKESLEVGVRPEGKHWSVANEEEEISSLVQQLGELKPTLIVVEGTGGFQALVVARLAAAALPVTVVNPRQVREFCQGNGAFG